MKRKIPRRWGISLVGLLHTHLPRGHRLIPSLPCLTGASEGENFNSFRKFISLYNNVAQDLWGIGNRDRTKRLSRWSCG